MHPNYLFAGVLVVGLICVVNARTHNLLKSSSTTTEVINNNGNNNIIIHTDESPGVIQDIGGIHYNPYSKHHPGRHVCTLQKNLTVPIKTKEIYCKPVYKKYVEPCHNNQLCTGVRLAYETSYKDVVTSKTTKHTTFTCCPGWIQVGNRSHGCNRPVCNTKCSNGGICVKPDLCKCLKGFSGQYCDTDVNECAEHKPCDQICHNTHGSYKCQCRENFMLESDGQSCRREGSDNGPGLEAKDLEYDLIDKRLHKLEMMFAADTPSKINNELNMLRSHVDGLSHEVKNFQHKLEEIDKYKNLIALVSVKLQQLEERITGIGKEHTKYRNQLFPWSNYFHPT